MKVRTAVKPCVFNWAAMAFEVEELDEVALADEVEVALELDEETAVEWLMDCVLDVLTVLLT